MNIYDSELVAGILEKCGYRETRKINNADAVFIMNNHRSFSELKINQLAETMNSPAILFDCWHTFQANEINSISNVIYSGIGIG